MGRSTTDEGVSVPFFCGAIGILTKQHGRKMIAPPMEEFRAALAEAERLYLLLPDEPKKERKAKKSDAR